LIDEIFGGGWWRFMGVKEDITWLGGDEEGVKKVFLLIADRGRMRIGELHKLFGVDDWWPVKWHLRALIDRGLVSEVDGNYSLTENGKKVLEGSKAMEYVEKL
jgi:predicted transcriptional regulator